jgi:succinoglycan biosynthesis protein ExoV
MQLFYYQRRDRVPNFGDELNQWLWQQLLPDVFDDDASTVFVGIGTLLNHYLPARVGNARRVILFSTGAGYEQPLNRIPDHWQIYCVRGPLTAKLLRLPDKLAMADGAILLRQIWFPDSSIKTTKFGFMPHIHHAISSGEIWRSNCEILGFRYVDPRWPMEAVLKAISETEVLITEAMHGAIAADALRVPWIPVITSPRILQFKWRDWCASMHLPYRPQCFPPLPQSYPRMARGIRSGGRSLWYWSRCLSQHPTLLWGNGEDQEQARLALQTAAQATPNLSSESLLNQRIEQLSEALTQFHSSNQASVYLPSQE